MELKRFRKSLSDSQVVKIGDYDYFVHPITDGVPRMEPSVLAEVLDAFKEIGDFRCDVIIAPEAMGIPIAVSLSLELGIPYVIVRKKRYGLPGELNVAQTTAYSKSEMYINGIGKGDRVLIVDSVISTGGTMRAMIRGLRKIGAEIVDILIAVDKGEGKEQLERELGIKIKTLVKIEVAKTKVIIID